MPRRLTNRQVQVLSALERTGKTTVFHLSEELPWLAPSQIWSVLQALIRRGLVEYEGDLTWVYAGTREVFLEVAGREPPAGFEPVFVWTVSK